ncbi:hypothetical protein [Paenarthrobacter sp. A20]|nr:hypothetical protein [Paenarthrobacter sp. A20]MCP1410756.1 hypothetical protein [Paenarthrobacter sp. A20]
MTKAVKMRFMLGPTGTFVGVERVGAFRVVSQADDGGHLPPSFICLPHA